MARKLFTPTAIDRFRREDRGLGIGASYTPWHQVRRSDPASLGRSHVLIWPVTGRQHHLLSDTELEVFLFASVIAEDIREQFPLSLAAAQSELASYTTRCCRAAYAGTLDICSKASVRHPTVYEAGRSSPWVLTTDLLVRPLPGWRSAGNELVPISVKYDSRLTRKRTVELNLIESTYWATRGFRPVLVGRNDYCPLVANAMRVTHPWALDGGYRPDLTKIAWRPIRIRMEGESVTRAISFFQEVFRLDAHRAQCLLWQAVWDGHLPADLSKLGRPSSQIKFLDAQRFWAQNPIAVRLTSARTADPRHQSSPHDAAGVEA
jgi:hypothetical protein